MNVVIIEDCKESSNSLKQLLTEIDSNIKVVETFSTVSQAIVYFRTSGNCDLAFMDLHLSDGISLEIFKEVDVKVPVIFTTAHREYALEAFKVNSIDYLIKPVTKEALEDSFKKLNLDSPTTLN